MSLTDPKILVVEDEPSQVAVLEYNLKREGYDVCVAIDGEEGLQQAQECLPDLILLDWMLPSFSGIEVCRRLRRNRTTREIPVIMLTARAEESEKVRGLDIGADDYVTKPYSVKELMARVQAALRRPSANVFQNVLSVGQISVDLDKHKVICNGEHVEISATEFRLLVILMQNPERVFSRSQLLDQVWGVTAELETRTVDVHIGRLRMRLRQAGAKDQVRTVRGFGYSLSTGA